jgi:hypothetical protein
VKLPVTTEYGPPKTSYPDQLALFVFTTWTEGALAVRALAAAGTFGADGTAVDAVIRPAVPTTMARLVDQGTVDVNDRRDPG